MKKLTTFLILLANLITCYAQETASTKTEVCDCPEPTRDQFMGICNSIYRKENASDESSLSYQYQEGLYEISCVKIGVDSKEVAAIKIQCMWNKYREKFRCYRYTDVSVSDGNVLKFAMDTGFSTFPVSAVKKYNLDMNFLDPADNKTIMDFLKENYDSYKRDGYTEKSDEYLRIYQLLKANGAKHSSELNK
nr:hypothetical protein [uncultured Flavobacterium sp.]